MARPKSTYGKDLPPRTLAAIKERTGRNAENMTVVVIDDTERMVFDRAQAAQFLSIGIRSFDFLIAAGLITRFVPLGMSTPRFTRAALEDYVARSVAATAALTTHQENAA